jgi:hypothetical protein
MLVVEAAAPKGYPLVQLFSCYGDATPSGAAPLAAPLALLVDFKIYFFVIFLLRAVEADKTLSCMNNLVQPRIILAQGTRFNEGGGLWLTNKTYRIFQVITPQAVPHRLGWHPLCPIHTSAY